MQGFCRNPKAASGRTCCKAMIRLHRTDNHSWIVTKTISEHNDELSDTYGQKKQWGSHGDIDPMTKDFIRKLRTNNVPLSHICNIIGVTISTAVNPIRKDAVRNLCTKLAQEDIKNDINKTTQLLETMQLEDEKMKVRFKKDEEGRITSMLWCMGKNRFNIIYI